METITLPAHFDGEHIRLDVPYELKPETKLSVTVILSEESEREKAAWNEISERGLEAAFGDDEPDYSSVVLKEENPKYEGG